MEMEALYWLLALGGFALFTYIMGRMQRGGSDFLDAVDRLTHTFFRYNRELDSTLYMGILAVLIWKFATDSKDNTNENLLIGGLISIGSFLYGKKTTEKENGVK